MKRALRSPERVKFRSKVGARESGDLMVEADAGTHRLPFADRSPMQRPKRGNRQIDRRRTVAILWPSAGGQMQDSPSQFSDRQGLRKASVSRLERVGVEQAIALVARRRQQPRSDKNASQGRKPHPSPQAVPSRGPRPSGQDFVAAIFPCRRQKQHAAAGEMVPAVRVLFEDGPSQCMRARINGEDRSHVCSP
jgi:hypothetical protein